MCASSLSDWVQNFDQNSKRLAEWLTSDTSVSSLEYLETRSIKELMKSIHILSLFFSLYPPISIGKVSRGDLQLGLSQGVMLDDLFYFLVEM